VAMAVVSQGYLLGQSSKENQAQFARFSSGNDLWDRLSKVKVREHGQRFCVAGRYRVSRGGT
jgi:hypothetical protein